MADTLTWNVRGGTMHGHVAGRVTGIAVDPADPSTGRIWDWEKVQELQRGGASRWIRVSTLTGGAGTAAHWDHSFEFRPGKWTATDYRFEAPRSGGKGYVLTGVQHSAESRGRRRITIAENAELDVFDYPGFYAVKRDGEAEVSRSQGGDPDQPVIVGAVPNAAPFFDPTFQGGVFVGAVLIHPWPPRLWTGPAIIVRSGWREFASAARQSRQVTLIAEM